MYKFENGYYSIMFTIESDAASGIKICLEYVSVSHMGNSATFSVNDIELTLLYKLDIDIDKCFIRSGLSCSIM